MLTRLSSITSTILNHEISHLHVMWINGHSIQWNIFGITETPGGGRLRPKHVVKGRSDGSSCIVDGMISCIIERIRLRRSWTVQRYVKGLCWKHLRNTMLCLAWITSGLVNNQIGCLLKTCPVPYCWSFHWKSRAQNIKLLTRLQFRDVTSSKTGPRTNYPDFTFLLFFFITCWHIPE
jgi:hypothetical protein